MVILLLIFSSFSILWSAEIDCPVNISSVSQLDECLEANNRKPTKSIREILNWKKKLNISSPMSIEVEKIQDIVQENCKGNESQRFLATKLSEEVGKILQAGSLQISDWRVPNFPETSAKNYTMKASHGCDVKDLLYQMKSDVEQILPDLMGVYNLGLAVDTTSSQEKNLQILAHSIDAIYESIPEKANISFAVTAYGDEFRSGLKFEGDKSYVLPRVKQFLLTQKIHGGGTAPEFVYGGSYITSKNLQRAHGLIFNWTNATGDNTTATSRQGKVKYELRDLNGFAKKNIHIIRNVFLTCR